jgi:RNA recognition motif-containing protein
MAAIAPGATPMAMGAPQTPSSSGGPMQDRSGMGLSRTASDAAGGRRYGEASFAVYVGNLAPSVSDEALLEAFKQFGTITKAQVSWGWGCETTMQMPDFGCTSALLPPMVAGERVVDAWRVHRREWLLQDQPTHLSNTNVGEGITLC